jgi:uroporphyrinogen-III synthase
VQNGRINAILVTSGSVAEQVREQFPDIPDSTLLAAIGPRTAKDAKKGGPADHRGRRQADRGRAHRRRLAVHPPHAADEFAP